MTTLHHLRRITGVFTAQRILAMIRGELDPREESEQCDRWVRQCYNEPSRAEQVLYAADELLGTYGVEGCADDDGRDGVSYCNTGDTYAATLFLDHGQFRVSDLGTMVETGRMK
jgi:hypothetical protein